jgi:Flp pilus assembly protein TadD
MRTIIAAMRLLSGLLAFAFAGLLLAGCQVTDGRETAPLQSRVDTSILEAAATSEQRGDFGNAASYYSSVYERDPQNVTVAVSLSRNLRYLERAREAEAVMERTLRSAPKDARLLAERGKVHLANNEAPEAVEKLSLAAQADDGNWDVHTALAVGFDVLGLYEQADRHYQKALAAAPDNAVVLNNYGLSLAQRGDLKRAVETLRRAASQLDASAKTRQNLALMYAMSGELTRAEELVRRDLPADVADQNMALYRELAGNRRFSDAAAVTRAAAERPGLGGAPSTAIAAAPLPPPPAAPAQAQVQAQALPSDVARQPADKPVDTKPADDKPADAKPADDKPMQTAAKPEAADKPGAPVPLTPHAATPVPVAADKAAEDKAAEDKAAGSRPDAASKTSGGDGTPYKLQLASFRREAQAEQAREQILAQHKEVLGEMGLEVSRINLGNRGDFYRVMSDALDSRAAAADLCRVLKTRNADCLLIRVEP